MIGSPDDMEPIEVVQRRVAERLASVKRVIAVMSGKGGVGKSAIAVNLAQALSQRGMRIGLLDADLQGPSVAKMLGLCGLPVRVAGGGVLNPSAGPCGIAVQSMDFFLQGSQPLDWDGPAAEGATMRSAMEQAALADLVGQTAWGDLDALVVDLAPGADRLPAFTGFLPEHLGEALAVTIPTEIAMLAVERSLRRAEEVGIPAIGIVENLGSSVCIKCGEEGPLYHGVSIDKLARNSGLDVVARIPFDPALSAAADRGEAYLEGPERESPAGRALRGLAEYVADYTRPGPEGESW